MKGYENMLKNMLNNLQNKYNTKMKENDNLEQLLQTSTIFQNLFPIPKTNEEPSENKTYFITNDCPDINEEKAKQIAKLLPLQETYLTVVYSKELLTNKIYYLILTNQYLWVISENNYGAYPYTNLTCQIIKNNLMSKVILLNNILLEVNGTTKIEKFTNMINNSNDREKIIQEKTSYLCNIIPIYQKINKNGSGISIDNQSNIVFHNKQNNFKCNINEISNYEILLDNQPYLSKNSNTSSKITSFQTSCFQISIRITTINNQIFVMPILEANTFNSKYTTHDSIFQTSIEFSKIIIAKLNELSFEQN